MTCSPKVDNSRSTFRPQLKAQTCSLEKGPLDGVHLAAQRGVLLDALLDLLNGRDHRRVVLAAERAREVGIAVLGVVARQVHRDGTRVRERLVAAVALDVRGLQTVVARDALDDVLDRDDL